MHRIVAQFLLVRFAGIFLFVLFALTSLLVLFDLLAHADDLAVHHQNTLWPMLWYAGLRLPVLLTMILPLSVLLAALVTFERLASQYELVALQSAGLSIYQVCAVLLAGGLGVGAAHFGLVAAVATPAEARLVRWEERNYDGLPTRQVLEPGAAWFAAGPYQVRIGNARENGRRLDEVSLVERPAAGTIASYCEAKAARFDGGRWTLLDGWRQTVGQGGRQAFAERTIDLPLEPQQVTEVRLPVSSLALGVLRAHCERPAASGAYPVQHYRTWLGRRWAEPLGSLVMIVLAAPLGLQLRRGGRQLRWGALAVGAGFLFFIAERILLALGESGALSPAFAVWSPLAVFGLAGLLCLTLVQK